MQNVVHVDNRIGSWYRISIALGETIGSLSEIESGLCIKGSNLYRIKYL